MGEGFAGFVPVVFKCGREVGVDVFAVACTIFALTGLGLMVLHAKGRPSTWPLAALGLLIPVVIALIFIH